MKHIYILLIVIAMTVSCSKQDAGTSLLSGTQSLANFDVEINVNMTCYDTENYAVNSKSSPITWADGAEIAFALDGSAKPAGKLKYDASSGTWSKVEIDNNAPVKIDGGTVCAIHADELSIDFGKSNAECKGNIVFTNSGTYKVSKNVIYFTLNLNQRVESRLVISGVDSKAKVLNVKNKRLTSFAGMQFEEYDGTGEGQYDADTKTLTVDGCFNDDGNGKTPIKIIYIEGANSGKVKTRLFENMADLGQSITIKGPDDVEQTDSWTDEGFQPTSIMLKNPNTGDLYTNGQSLICPKNVIFATVCILPDNASDKSFTVTCNPSYGQEGIMAEKTISWSNNLISKSKGLATVTVTASNGVKTTLDINVVEKSFYIDGFRYETLIGGGVQLVKPDLEGKFYGTVEPIYQGDVVIPATVTYDDMAFPVLGIGPEAFSAIGTQLNEAVTSITMGENITFMSNSAILNLPNLTTININKKLKTNQDIDKTTPFQYCKNLSTINVEDGNEYFIVEDGVLYCRTSLDQDIHHNCTCVIPQYSQPVVLNGKTVVILDGSINNVQTPSVEIPGSVKDFGMFLFGGEGTNLASVKIPWGYEGWRDLKVSGMYQSALTNIYLNYFIAYPADKDITLYVPSSALEYYQSSLSVLGKALMRVRGTTHIVGY